MKKMTFLFVLLMQAITLFSQTQESQQLKADYLKKSKNKKKAANILLVGGGVLVVTAFIFPKGAEIPGSIVSPTSYKNHGIRGALFYTGALSMLSSVPLYLSSAKNKRRANAVSLNIHNQKILFPLQGNLMVMNQPAVRVRVGL